MKKLFFLLTLGSFLMISKFGFSQCTVASNDPNPTLGGLLFVASVNSSSSGQTFVACQTGDMVSVEVFVNSLSLLAPPYQVTLQIGSGTDPTNPASVLSTSTHAITSPGSFVMNLPSPLPVTGGDTMYFYLEGGPPNGSNGSQVFLDGSQNDPYPDGVVIQGVSPGLPPYVQYFYGTTEDLNFNIEIVGPSTPVPTLSQWGQIILCLLILCLGAIVLWNKQYRPNEKVLKE